MMRSSWVIFCGLLRDREVSLEKIRTLARWKNEGRIEGVVCCWWRRESDRNPDIVEEVLRLGFKLVQLEEPRLRTVGHTIHQAMTWWYALQAVPKLAFVLKVRPDLGGLDDSMIDAARTVNLDLDPPAGWPMIFTNKILTANAFANSPYYFHDITFYGRREDLLKLANFDLTSEYICANLSPEQMLFRGVFSAYFPLVDSYLMAYPPLLFDDPERSEAKMAVLLRSDYYLDVFSAYVRIIDTYFRLGFVSEEARLRFGPLTGSLENLLNGKIPHPDVQFHEGASALVFCGDAAISAILSGGVELGRGSLKRAVERTADYSYIANSDANPLEPQAELVDLVASLQGVMIHDQYKLDRQRDPNHRHYVVLGHHDRVGLTSSSDQVKSLEVEISHLRRTIDDLRASKTGYMSVKSE